MRDMGEISLNIGILFLDLIDPSESDMDSIFERGISICMVCFLWFFWCVGVFFFGVLVCWCVGVVFFGGLVCFFWCVGVFSFFFHYVFSVVLFVFTHDFGVTFIAHYIFCIVDISHFIYIIQDSCDFL